MILVVGILAATALLSGQLAAYMAFRSRGSRSAVVMAFLMSATAWWSAWNVLEYLAPGLTAKLFFANLEYLAIVAIPVLWFALGSSLEQEKRGGTARRQPRVIWIVPAATAVLVWTDPYLGFVRHSFHLEVQSGFEVIAKEFGPWFWVHSAYSYIFLIAGTVLILKALHSNHGTRRAQGITLVVGTLLPVMANLVYLARIFPLGSIDPTPLAFSLTGLLTVLNLTRFRFLALVTTAQATAIEQFRDAVLIIDRDGHLAYVNAAARNSFPTNGRAIGERLIEMGPPYSQLPSTLETGSDARTEESVLSHGERLYETRTGDIVKRGRRIGSVVTFFDVTRRVAAEEGLKKANLLLEHRIAERTRALEESNLKLTEELDNRKRAERQLTYDVLHDALTGLANRSLALSRIEQLLMRSHRDPTMSYAILHLDFDGLKTINDRFGHSAGDSFLCEVASRLKRSIREVDLAARVGGDEFVVLLDGLTTTENLEKITDRVVDNLSVPIHFGSSAVIPSASIGMVAGRSDYKDPHSILYDAEIAVHRAKSSSGRNMRVIFSEEMRLQVNERNLLSDALRAAIASGEITLAFQPIVRMDGSKTGWEVLARWRHAQLGPIGPDRFIPIAEESGLIIPLGAYILIETLKTVAALRSEGLLDDGRPEVAFFAVNVSAIQFGQQDFSEFVLSSMDRLALPHAMLHLELTESAIMVNRDVATHVIEQLSAAGISFKLDDFGIGYSSLGYLHRIPINCVKIDRSFISRMDLQGDQSSAGIVRGMISLSHELRKTVVAEGIETEAQARMLQECGCDFAQGYYFGKPLDKTALFESLHTAKGL
jgi:diguanylate cyclase (GGDEF)-like protein